MKDIYLAGGCFWGVQRAINLIKGVEKTVVGYANGTVQSPTYEMVKTGQTNFVEAVLVRYDEKIIYLEEILELFFIFIDPTSLNKQGNDKGTQYRTGIYYLNNEDELVIAQKLHNLQTKYQLPIMVEFMKLKNFYTAEDYHQKYLEKNPNGYCHISSDKYEEISQYIPIQLKKQ